jgi:hypothetical protein
MFDKGFVKDDSPDMFYAPNWDGAKWLRGADLVRLVEKWRSLQKDNVLVVGGSKAIGKTQFLKEYVRVLRSKNDAAGVIYLELDQTLDVFEDIGVVDAKSKALSPGFVVNLKHFFKAAADWKKEHPDKQPVLIIDGLNIVASEHPEVIGNVAIALKDAVDNKQANVIVVLSDGPARPIINKKTHRVLHCEFDDEMTLEQVKTMADKYFAKTPAAKPDDDELRLILDLTGGRAGHLSHCFRNFKKKEADQDWDDFRSQSLLAFTPIVANFEQCNTCVTKTKGFTTRCSIISK